MFTFMKLPYVSILWQVVRLILFKDSRFKSIIKISILTFKVALNNR